MRRILLLVLALLGPLLPATAPAQNVEGTGQQATNLFPLQPGLAVFELRYQGRGPFTVRLLDESGAVVEQLAQAAQGPWEGSRAVSIPRAGRFLYDVSAAGPWAIRLRGADTGAASATEVPAELGATYDGMLAARNRATLGWLASGLVAGVLTGPLGAGVNLAVAANRGATVPPDVLAQVASRDADYRERFAEAFRGRIRANRRTAALVGGATGTLIFGLALWQLTGGGGGRQGGNPGGGGGDLP